MSETEQMDRLTDQADPVSKPADRSPEAPQQAAKAADRLTRKSEWSNWTVLAMIILCFFLIVRFRPFDRADVHRRAAVGKTLPRLKLRPLTGGGEPVTLGDLTGRVVLISFFGTWSSESRDALPRLAEIDEKFHGHPAFRFLAVSCPQDENVDFIELRRRTRALVAKEEVDLPTYTDSDGVSRSAVDQVVGLNSFPTTLILDRRGRVRRVWVGFARGVEDEMRQLIPRLLAEG